jgi:uncharacterized protein YkwD
MRVLAVIGSVLIGVVLMAVPTSAASGRADEGLVSPRETNTRTKDVYMQERAQRLFQLARTVNAKLSWDDCLAEQARRRARTMVKRQYFDHKDPRTGIKPAWYLVRSCHRCQYAGENLTRGDETPELLHEVLMQSATHRKNILDSKFRLLGVGCYDDVCVELFAGF